MGYATALQCVHTVEEAASIACATAGGISGAGHVSCTGVASTGTASAVLDLQFAAPAATTAVAVPVHFEVCDVRDLAYYTPIIGLWVLGMVSLLGVRWLRRVFDWERA